MTAWTAVLGPFAVTLAVLVLPGLALGAALRLRGLLLAGSAVPLSVGAVAGSAVVAPLVGVPWSAWCPVVATAVGVLVLLVVARSAPAPSAVPTTAAASSRRARRAVLHPPEGRLAQVAGLLGAGTGAVLVALVVRRSVVSPELISQSADAGFHLNAVQQVLASRDASSLHLGRLTAPDASTAFYPAAWHDVVSLVVQLTGVTIPVATNLLALAVSAVVWPLGAVALTRQVLPGSAAGAAAAGVLAAGLPAFPALMLIWGVLYPSLLAVALLPSVLATVACLLRRGSPADRPGTLPLVALLLCEVGGTGLAHPSAVAGLAALAGPLVVAVGLAALGAGWRDPRRRTRVAWTAVGTAVAGLALGAAVVRSDLLRSVSAYVWPARTSVPQAVGEALLNAPPGGWPPVVATSALALVGAAVLVVRRQQRWLVAGWLVVVALYVVAQTTESHPLTGPWYNDAYRLAALLPVPVVVLAAVGAVAVVDVVADRLAWRLQARHAPWLVTGAAVAPVVLAVAAAAGPGNGMGTVRQGLEIGYPGDAPSGAFVSADEVALYERIADEVPPGAVIANDPFQGTSVVLAVAGRTPLFTHLNGRWDDERLLIAAGLDRVGTDPQVCAAVRARGVGFLLSTGPRGYDDAERAALFGGVLAAADSGAFELVDSVGEARLYRLTSCAGEPDPS